MSSIVADKCVFTRAGNPQSWDNSSEPASNSEASSDSPCLTIATYVDDLTITGTKQQTEWLMAKLRGRFELTESETGNIEYILSMNIKRDRSKKTLSLNQTLAIEKIATGLGITEVKPSVKTAMKTAYMEKLTEPDPSCTNFPYLNTVGSLLHVAQCSRPDIAYAVGALARHSCAVGPEHVKAAKACVQYLYNTKDLSIHYGPTNEQPNEPTVFEAGRKPPEPSQSSANTQPANDPTDPEAFVDADYAMDKATRKSTTGGVIFLNGGPISWSSRQQKIVAQSTAEAEIIAATEVTKEVVHIKLLLTELGVRKTDAPILVNEDNQACILMGNGMKSSRAAKHYEVRLHFLQESIKSKVIRFKYCPTDAMIADCLTKPLDTEKFIYFRDMLLK